MVVFYQIYTGELQSCSVYLTQQQQAATMPSQIRVYAFGRGKRAPGGTIVSITPGGTVAYCTPGIGATAS